MRPGSSWPVATAILVTGWVRPLPARAHAGPTVVQQAQGYSVVTDRAGLNGARVGTKVRLY